MPTLAGLLELLGDDDTWPCRCREPLACGVRIRRYERVGEALLVRPLALHMALQMSFQASAQGRGGDDHGVVRVVVDVDHHAASAGHCPHTSVLSYCVLAVRAARRSAECKAPVAVVVVLSALSAIRRVPGVHRLGILGSTPIPPHPRPSSFIWSYPWLPTLCVRFSRLLLLLLLLPDAYASFLVNLCFLVLVLIDKRRQCLCYTVPSWPPNDAEFHVRRYVHHAGADAVAQYVLALSEVDSLYASSLCTHVAPLPPHPTHVHEYTKGSALNAAAAQAEAARQAKTL
ncbi:hypothetical protein RI054_08g42080 [Pseudoscourfieldia marina]